MIRGNRVDNFCILLFYTTLIDLLFYRKPFLIFYLNTLPLEDSSRTAAAVLHIVQYVLDSPQLIETDSQMATHASIWPISWLVGLHATDLESGQS